MKFHHGCGQDHKTSGVPIWLPSPPPACIEIVDPCDCCEPCDCVCTCGKRPRRRHCPSCQGKGHGRGCRPCRPSCPPRHCCPPPCPPQHCCPPFCPPPCPPQHCGPQPFPPFCPPPCPPQHCGPQPFPPPIQPFWPPHHCWPPVIERELQFVVCPGSVWEILCVEVEVECVRVFQRECQTCLLLTLCVTLQYRDHFSNCHTFSQSVCVETCDVPLLCGCRPPRVEICHPQAEICDGLVKITAPARICP